MAKLQQAHGDLNEADALRTRLERLERGIGGLNAGSVEAWLGDFAASRAGLLSLEADGVDVRSERARYDDLGARIIRRAGSVVGMAGGPVAYVALREKLSVQGDEPAWRLEAIDRLRRLRRRNIVISLIGALALVGFVGWLFRAQLFPKDPTRDAMNAALRALGRGSPTEALAELETGLTITPTSTTLLIWRGALLTESRPDEAAASFARAQALTGEVDFLLDRGDACVQTGQPARALPDLNRAAALQPNSPIPPFLRANAHEALGDRAATIEDLETASTLAQKQGNDFLSAQIRVRLGYLIAP